VVFDAGLKLEIHGAKVTFDGGLIPYLWKALWEILG
jgi:hypothetical protein